MVGLLDEDTAIEVAAGLYMQCWALANTRRERGRETL